MTDRYTIPAHVAQHIAESGYPNPERDMDSYIEKWRDMFDAHGDFWDYSSKQDGVWRRVHRRSVRPAARVCAEWASLMLDEQTTVSCEDQACNEWLRAYYEDVSFFAYGQDLVARAFALGTAAWALQIDPAAGRMQVRRYDANQVVPLSWDDDGVSECAFCTAAYLGGRRVDQLQMHLRAADGYHIVTTVWDAKEGKEIAPEGIEPDFATGCPTPTFAVVKPAIANTCVDLSPYGQSVYEDAIDALKSVDLCFDAVMNEVDLAKMRIFLSDMLITYTVTGEDGEAKTRNAIPFGEDNTVFRKVSSTEDMVQEFAPAMRTESQKEAYRLALQTMGDLCGFGLGYFDVDDSGGVKTATEVSADNSQLMRNIRKHENALARSIKQITRAVLFCAREHLGAPLGDPGLITVNFDDSIISDTAAQKAQDLAEVGVTMNAWEYRRKWYGEDEETAKANVPASGVEPMFGE